MGGAVPDAPPGSPTPESVSLVALAGRVAAADVARARPPAVLLAGSAAAGISDRCSGLDLLADHDAPPRAADLLPGA
jgi:hypothetical protein